MHYACQLYMKEQVHSDFSLANGLKSCQGQQNGDEESEALISDHREASPGHSPNMP